MSQKTLTLAQRVSARLRAGALVTIVQESDEQLALAEIKPVAEMYRPVEVVSVSNPEAQTKLEEHAQGRGVLILLDFLSAFGENPMSMRLIRQINLQVRPDGESYSRLILVEQPWVKIPQGLTGDVEIVSAKLPSVDELKTELDSFVRQQSIELPGNGEMRYFLASAVSGLARHEASRLFARSFVENNKVLDPVFLREEKALRVTQRLQGALTFENVEGPDLGGYDILLADLQRKKSAFGSSKAREFGLPNPKGILVVGPPGNGKSALARYIARLFGVPLERLDMGAVYGSLVGQSEARIRQALESAVASSPCVLWVDEIEKGVGQNGLDGGTSSRVVGTLLTWLQENKEPVFVYATANDVSRLPPELLRAGRFDGVYYAGLPDEVDRRDILGIHLAKRKRTLTPDEIENISFNTEGYSGAELEQSITDALFVCFAEEARDLTRQDVLNAAKKIVPVSKTSAEVLRNLETWAAARARPTSSRKALGTTTKPDPLGDISQSLRGPKIG